MEITDCDLQFGTKRRKKMTRDAPPKGLSASVKSGASLMRRNEELVPVETIERQIYLMRGQKVMIDRDLAALYGVKTRVLNQAVRRNRRRFPADFMFQMNQEEFRKWRSQIVISKKEKMGVRYRPLIFTEQGVAMLSSVLNSDRAIAVNIVIMRAFVRLREWLSKHKDFGHRLDELERRYHRHDDQIHAVFEAIRSLMQPPRKRRRPIGFLAPGKV